MCSWYANTSQDNSVIAASIVLIRSLFQRRPEYLDPYRLSGHSARDGSTLRDERRERYLFRSGVTAASLQNVLSARLDQLYLGGPPRMGVPPDRNSEFPFLRNHGLRSIGSRLGLLERSATQQRDAG